MKAVAKKAKRGCNIRLLVMHGTSGVRYQNVELGEHINRLMVEWLATSPDFADLTPVEIEATALSMSKLARCTVEAIREIKEEEANARN